MANLKRQPSLFQRAKQVFITACSSIKTFLQKKWHYYEPKLTKLTTITSVATSASSTLKLSFSVLPILEIAITTIAAAPLLSFLVPNFLYSPFFYYPLIIGISALAGYMKYQELIERAKLDLKISENEASNEKLTKTIEKLGKDLTQTQRSLTHLEKKYAHTSKIIAPLKQARATTSRMHQSAANAMPRRSERLTAKTRLVNS